MFLFLKMTNMSLLMVFSNVHFVKLCEVLFLLYTLEYYQFIFSTHTVFLITQNSEKEKGLEFYFVFFFLLMNCHTVIVRMNIYI